MFKHAVLILGVLLLASCAPKVAMQTVPVSTDPIGAEVMVNGKPAGTTPCQVSLERNQDHILTVTKEGYRQQDVVIKRQYQTGKVLVNAINQGAQSGKFFNNAWMGANAGVMSLNSQEETGEAYVLTPSTVSLRLTPADGFPARHSAAQADEALASPFSPLDVMSVSDQQMLENALELCPTGETKAWTNTETGTSFSMVPEDATQDESGNVTRWFTLGARQQGHTSTKHYRAYRAGQGEWTLSVPESDGSADSGADEPTERETLRALGQLSWPSAGKSWDLGSSGSSHTHTSTTQTESGTSTTTTTTSTKTSVRAGVNVSPGAVFSVLDALTGLGD